MRFVLVDNFLWQGPTRGIATRAGPHLGLLSIAAALRGHGVEVSLAAPTEENARLDGAPFGERVADEILAHAPDAVGFTAMGVSLPFAAAIAAAVRARTADIPILLGGPHGTLVGDRILERHPAFDVVVRGEAEPLVPALLEGVDGARAWPTIPGLFTRERGRIVATGGTVPLPDLADLPPLPYDLYGAHRLTRWRVPIEVGRGCPFACCYCSTSGFFSRAHRLRPVDAIASEMDRLASSYGVRHFDLTHDLFGLERDFVLALCERLEGRGARWSCSMRPDRAEPDLLDAMRAAGCDGLYFGIEVGSAELQRAIGKHLDPHAAAETVLRATEAGFDCTASFVTGFPDEDEARQDETLALFGSILARSGGAAAAQLHVLEPEPGAPLFETRGHDLRRDGLDFEVPPVIGEPELRADPALYATWHHYPAPTGRLRSHLAATLWRWGDETIGRVLFAHLLHVGFEGSYAGLVDAVADHLPAGTSDRGRLRAARGPAVEHALAALPVERRYLRELVRVCRRVLEQPPLDLGSSSSPSAEERAEAGAQLLERGASIECTHDVPGLLAWIRARPRDLPPARLRDGRATRVLGLLDESSGPTFLPLEGDDALDPPLSA